MKTEFIYLRWALAIFVAIVGFGFLAPVLISSPTDIGLITGVVVIVLVPLIAYWLLKPIYKKTETVTKTKKKKSMKNLKTIIGILIVGSLLASCGRVDPGYVGVKVKTLGQNKGIEPTGLDVGRYWMGILYDLYTYPTFVNIYPFTLESTDGSEVDEAFRFQSIEGITCNVDLAISAHADPANAVTLFQTYRKEMVPIIKEMLRQDVNNYFVDYASKLRVDELYSTKKMDMLNYAKDQLIAKVSPNGIIIDDISFKSDIRFPIEVQKAIIAKIEAIQLATQKQNEIVQAEADAKKLVAKAQGEYEAKLLEAKGNMALSNSISDKLVMYNLSLRWNGVSPIYSGNGSVLPPLFSK